MTLSVVIPVLNGAEMLALCLDSLNQSTTPADQCIVVDDGSWDNSAAVARAAGATVVALPRHAGPAAARNRGARYASGDLLVFLDADVCVRADTLERLRTRFENDPGLDAVFGSYDDEPAAPGFLSQFKNLFHHYMHQRGRREASTFWSGCGAVRREIFLAAGGFDESYKRPCIEDIDFGYRLKAAGRSIALDAGIQVKHLKSWRFLALLRSDIFQRALPWTRLILRSAWLPDDLNVAVLQRVSALLVLAAAALLSAGLAAAAPPALALAPLAAAVALNRNFYRFLAAKRGWLFLAGALPLHLLYYLYSAAAFASGVALHLLVWRWQVWTLVGIRLPQSGTSDGD